jgi:hypothetical protein
MESSNFEPPEIEVNSPPITGSDGGKFTTDHRTRSENLI